MVICQFVSIMQCVVITFFFNVKFTWEARFFIKNFPYEEQPKVLSRVKNKTVTLVALVSLIEICHEGHKH